MYVFGDTVTWTINHGEGVRSVFLLHVWNRSVLLFDAQLLALIHMSQSTSISHVEVPENSSVVSLNFSSQQVWMAS